MIVPNDGEHNLMQEPSDEVCLYPSNGRQHQRHGCIL